MQAVRSLKLSFTIRHSFPPVTAGWESLSLSPLLPPSVSLVGAVYLPAALWRQRTHALKRKGNRRAVLHRPSSSSSVIRLKAYSSLERRGEEWVRGGGRPEMVLLGLKTWRVEGGVRSIGTACFFKRQRQKLWCWVPPQQKRTLWFTSREGWRLPWQSSG